MSKAPTHPFAIRFSDKQLEELRDVSEKQGLPVATLIKVCVEAMLRAYRENPASLNLIGWVDVARQLDNRGSDLSAKFKKPAFLMSDNVPFQGVAEEGAVADYKLTKGPVGVISAGPAQETSPVRYRMPARAKKPKPEGNK